MRPTIYYVANEGGKKHRAFSGEQAAFCGRVSNHGRRWFHCSSSPSRLSKQNCRECAESELNGEVRLVMDTFVPVRST